MQRANPGNAKGEVSLYSLTGLESSL
jgi:hypothetical protein